MVVPLEDHDKAANFFVKLPNSTAQAVYYELRREYRGAKRLHFMESQRTKWTVARTNMRITSKHFWNDAKSVEYLADLVSNKLTILYDFCDHPGCSGSI